MGRLEKIVVLTVLFLVAVVLGVALNPGTPEPSRGPTGTLPGPKSLPTGALAADLDLSKPITEPPLPAATSKETLKPAAPAGSETAQVQGVPPGTVAPPPAPAPPPTAFLLTTEGLTPSAVSDMMFYTWKEGDTLAALAQRYYGSKDKLARLQKANEGCSDASLRAGERIWVPSAAATPAVPPTDGTDATVGTLYVVQSGDVLSQISTKFYGTSKKWQKILDANRDILSAPERLRPGMKLRIPE